MTLLAILKKRAKEELPYFLISSLSSKHSGDTRAGDKTHDKDEASHNDF
jgi:hypothetical protein